MSKLPAVTSRHVISVLKDYGFHLDHTTGSHFIFFHPVLKRRVTVPHHRRDVPKGTLLAILKQSGLSREDF